MNARSTPIGNSDGATTLRATASASAQSAAPHSAHAGSRARAPEPTMRRATCGTMSPMNPTIPASATPGGCEQRGRSEDQPLRAIHVDADRARAYVANAQRVE